MDVSFENSSEKQRKSERPRGPLGFEYEAQTQVIRQKHGNLEQIRHRLGLSKRKISQILMVDPSAWTRWTRPGEDAPPHIYRALEWYLLLQEKYPGMDSPFWLEAVGRPTAAKAETAALREGIQKMEIRIKNLKRVQLAVLFLVGILAVSLALTSCSTAPKSEFKPTAIQEVPHPDLNSLDLAKKFAPIFVHEVGPNPKADVFTRVDFDGDWIGDNNWANMDKFELKPMAYYEVLSTKTHHYIMYGIFHPRDYSYVCLPIICHENDLEGVLVVVDRQSGKWVYTESVAHNYILSQKNTKDQSRPTLVIEWGGHGIYPPGESAPDRETVVYNPQVYSLEPIAKLWNLQFQEPQLYENTFEYKGERFRIGNLPKNIKGLAWSRGATNPPWAWVDWKQGVRGDLFFDPAHYVAKKHGLSDMSLEYERNPYLVGPAAHGAGARGVSASQ